MRTIKRIREMCTRIVAAERGDELDTLFSELQNAISELQNAIDVYQARENGNEQRSGGSGETRS